MPGPLSRTQISSGRRDRLVARRRAQAHARAIRGGQLDLAVDPLVADRLGGVLDEIEEHLDELVA